MILFQRYSSSAQFIIMTPFPPHDHTGDLATDLAKGGAEVCMTQVSGGVSPSTMRWGCPPWGVGLFC